jgi:hypothetical protein
MNDARSSRARGNEGRARVCARRAAGLAIGSYLEAQSIRVGHRNAYLLLQAFSELKQVPDRLREAAARLTVQVKEDHNLPHEQDPLEDAQLIIAAILEGEI